MTRAPRSRIEWVRCRPAPCGSNSRLRWLGGTRRLSAWQHRGAIASCSVLILRAWPFVVTRVPTLSHTCHFVSTTRAYISKKQPMTQAIAYRHALVFTHMRIIHLFVYLPHARTHICIIHLCLYFTHARMCLTLRWSPQSGDTLVPAGPPVAITVRAFAEGPTEIKFSPPALDFGVLITGRLTAVCHSH